MKFRSGFVTNSSSTSYIVKLKGETSRDRDVRAFVEEYYDQIVSSIVEFYTGAETKEEIENEISKSLRARRSGSKEELGILMSLPKKRIIKALSRDIKDMSSWPRRAKHGCEVYLEISSDEEYENKSRIGRFAFKKARDTENFSIRLKEIEI